MNTGGEGYDRKASSCGRSTYKVALKGMVRNEGFEMLVHGRPTWWLLAETANDYGPGWVPVQAWSVGDGRQIERVPLFRTLR